MHCTLVGPDPTATWASGPQPAGERKGASFKIWDRREWRGGAGKNFPTVYRRKTGKNSVSASSREMEFRKFSVFSVLNLKNSKKIEKNMIKNWVFF